jgi:hypothetical protein
MPEKNSSEVGMHALKLAVLFPILVLLCCSRISNGVNPSRLDCGADVDTTQSYTQFFDSNGWALGAEELELRALDGSKSQPILTSQGCLQTNQRGLWLIRHRQRSIGGILDTQKLPAPQRFPLTDISRENFTPQCPAAEISVDLNLQAVLPHANHYDGRGYEVQLTVNDAIHGIKKEYPWVNSKFLPALGLQTVFAEGPKTLTIKTLNHFRKGELMEINCHVCFDYTGPDLGPDISNADISTYKKRPFFMVDSSRNIRFTDRMGDLKSVDVCWRSRPDWNAGTIEDTHSALAPNSVDAVTFYQ